MKPPFNVQIKLKKAWEVTGVRRDQAASAVSEAQPICFQHIYKYIYQEKWIYWEEKKRP